MSKAAGIIYKARPFLKEETLKTIYYSFVYPYLYYGVIAWGNTYDSYLTSVNIAHKRIIRTMASARKYEHTEPLFKRFKLLTLHQIYKYNCSMFMFKRYHSMLPMCFNDMFCLNSDIHSYPTRQSNYFHCKIWNLDIMRRSVRIEGVTIWNKIVSKIDIDCSLGVFKHKIKYLLNNEEI